MNGLEYRTDRIASTLGVDLAVHHFTGVDSVGNNSMDNDDAGDRPPLIICHATGFHAHCYRPIIPHLTAHFDVWGLDFRGHGASTSPAGDDYAWSGFAADLLAAIDHIGAPNVVAFGHSMGGASILLAEKERPGTISRAWLYEPIIFPASVVPRNSMMAEAARKRRADFDSRAEALHRYASRPPLNSMRADALHAYVEYGFADRDDGGVTLACTPEAEAGTFDNAGVAVDEIRDLELHAIIGCGETLEGVSAADFSGPTAEALANGTLVQYDRLAHFGPMQEPDRIAADAVNFLTSV